MLISHREKQLAAKKALGKEYENCIAGGSLVREIADGNPPAVLVNSSSIKRMSEVYFACLLNC